MPPADSTDEGYRAPRAVDRSHPDENGHGNLRERVKGIETMLELHPPNELDSRIQTLEDAKKGKSKSADRWIAIAALFISVGLVVTNILIAVLDNGGT